MTPRAAFGVTPLEGGHTLGPAEPDLRVFWTGAFRSGEGCLWFGDSRAAVCAPQ